MERILVGEREAAVMLALTPAALRKWRQRKCGPAFIRISGRCVRYRLEDLERFLAQRVVTPGNGARAQ